MNNFRILVPLDNSPLSTRTIQNLIAFKEHIRVPLTLLHVVDFGLLATRGFPETTFDQFRQRVREEGKKFIADRKEQFSAAGIPAETMLREGEARETICAIADSGDYDLLVVGRHADSELRTLLFGQVANFLVHNVKCPVLIV